METTRTPLKHMRKQMPAVAALAVLAIGFTACSDDDEPQATPEPTTHYTLKRIGTEITEARYIGTDGTVTPLTDDDTRRIFGQRPDHAAPAELLFKEDSLYLVYDEARTEGYLIRRQDKKLTVYDDATDSWKETGEQKDHTFRLNAWFRHSESGNAQRSLIVTEQAYGSLPAATNAANSRLRVNYIFETSTSK